LLCSPFARFSDLGSTAFLFPLFLWFFSYS
jgi:hypothetical protein